MLAMSTVGRGIAIQIPVSPPVQLQPGNRCTFMPKPPRNPLQCSHCRSHDVRREPFEGFDVLICRPCGEKWLDPAYDNLAFDIQAEARVVCDALVS